MTTATDMVAFYTAAEAKVLKGQTIRHGDRQLTLANLQEIRDGRREWEARVARESGSGGGFKAADFRSCGE